MQHQKCFSNTVLTIIGNVVLPPQKSTILKRLHHQIFFGHFPNLWSSPWLFSYGWQSPT